MSVDQAVDWLYY